jgi:hypothetical protein
VGIILAAEAGVIFVGFRVEAFYWFQAADRRSEIGVWSGVAASGVEIAHGAVKREQIIDEGNSGNGQECVCDKRQNLFTSYKDAGIVRAENPNMKRGK